MSYKLWLKTYLKHPLQLGALFPSSSVLGSLMVSHISPNSNGHILELGSGTGSVTRALIRIGIPQENLVLVEKSLAFTILLKDLFPRAKVICGDAKDAAKLLDALGIEEVDQIISAIPLNAIGSTLSHIICNGGFEILKSGGSFVQVSYLPKCSIPKTVIAAHSAEKIYCGMTVRNFPPGFVWRAEKP